MRNILLVGLTGALLLLGAETEKKVRAAAVPAAVKAAVAKQFPNAKVKEWSEEVEGTEKEYEASLLDGTVRKDVLLDATGKIVVIEETIAATELPAPVTAALKANYPKATIRVAEKLTRGTVIEYEVGLAKAKVKEVVFSPDGKILKSE